MRSLLRDEIARIAGSFEIGGGVTIFRHDQASPLVHVHEQTHRDNVNNTLFGYWVTRLRDLGDETPPGGDIAAARLLGRALTSAWTTLEGAATFAEFIHVQLGFVPVRRRAWERSLPREYARAFGRYERAFGDFLTRRAPRNLVYMVSITMAHAVAECALDDAIAALPATPARFADLTATFAAAAPDAALLRYLQAVRRIDPAMLQGPLSRTDGLQDGSALGREVRRFVMAFKSTLLAIVQPQAECGMLSDVDSIAARQLIDAALIAERPGLHARHWLTRIQGPAMTADLRAFEPSWQLPQEHIATATAIEHVRAAQAQDGILRTAIAFLRDPQTDRYGASITPVSVEARGDRRIVNLRSTIRNFDPQADDLLAIDAALAGTAFFWLSYLLPMRAAPTDAAQPYDWDFVLRLRAPVFLYGRSFHAHLVAQLAAFLGADVRLSQHALFADRGARLDLLTLAHRHVTMLWIVSGLSDQASQDAGWVELGDHRFERTDEMDEGLHSAAAIVLAGWGAAE